MKTVYTCFCTDVIHEGHLNIINNAKKLGRVVVGALCDKELIRFNKFPTKTLEERIKLYQELDGVDEVIVQNDAMYNDVIDTLKPDYIVHGDNWKEGAESSIRANVVKRLAEYGGEVVDVPYTYNPTVKKIDAQLKEKLAMPEYRRKRLRQLIEMGHVVKTIEAHSGLTGLIAEKTVVEHEGKLNQFDAMWVSSLCDSTAKGKPDIELVDMTSRFRTIDDIMEVTTKPIIFDGDTGGLTEHFVYTVRSLERMGVSAVIIEDKKGLKKNSLFGTEVKQTQATIEEMSAKIAAGKAAQLSDDFMIIARIESLILEQGMEDALARAQQKGYAERNPAADVEGHDACRKICILASLVFGKHVYPDSVHTEGITKVSLTDVEYAAAWGGVIKLIGSVKLTDGKQEILVAPMFVSDECQLSSVDGVFNAILVKGDSTGDVVFYGKGAGKLPTASAVVADVMDCVNHQAARRNIMWEDGNADNILPFEQTKYAMYVLADADDTEAAFAAANDAFGECGRLSRKNAEKSELAFVTPVLTYADFEKAVEKFEQSGAKVVSNIRVAVI